MRTRTVITGITGTAVATTLTLGAAALLAIAKPRRPVEGARPPEPPPGLPPGRVVHVPGRGEMFVREAEGPPGGDAPTILLLHGWMFPADLNWFACYGPLSELGRVIAVDHRGHGRGPRPSEPFRLADVADDAAALLRHLGTGPVIAVGYSMGGPVSQLLWQRHPDLVAGLVQCATSATFNDTARERWQWRSMGALQVVLRMLPRQWMEAGARLHARGDVKVRLSKMIHEETPEELENLLPWIIAELDRDSAEDIAEAGRELGRYEARGWIGGVDVPTAVLVTARDQLVPAFRQHDLARRVPDVFVQELPLDHDGVAARPDLFVPALMKAISHVVAARRDG
jgi:pimeloyl-ACP methyl ester carboxylesterase